ncbi:MAG: YraN family protein, partial [Deltaproteobacteria bacterium]|nr:YraN family protein [Deltaproteobacteria bacterium]
MDNRQAGSAGEDIAAGFLARAGYQLRERNWRCREGEIDLVAVKDGYLVIVEVKARTAGTMYHPTANITPAKVKKLRRLGEQYMADHPDTGGLQPRFDVVAVELTPGAPANAPQ